MLENTTANIVVDMDTQLVPPAVITCDVPNIISVRATGAFLIDGIFIVKGIVSQQLTYKTFDIQSNIVSNTITNEKDFNISIPIHNCQFNENLILNPNIATLTGTFVTSSLSGIDVYHRVFAHVAFNLQATILVRCQLNSLDFDNYIISHSESDNSYSPQLTGIFSKKVSISLRQNLLNHGLSNLNIKRFLITNVSRVFAETILCECRLIYSFFNGKNELVGTERCNFNFVIDSPLVNSSDNYTIVDSDILAILNTNVSHHNSLLTENLNLIIVAQKKGSC